MPERKFVRSERIDESHHSSRSSCLMEFKTFEVTRGNHEGTPTIKAIFTDYRGELTSTVELPCEVAEEIAKKILYLLGNSAS